ncbi:host-nuclease inhibitor Gam family protein [Arhodomonas aquaeolei]|uniref:host-nuclease inhibitor Gam family protein n=1 Tax=Arhodomonas aquaeolei TaxID=2369 RepID=UPI0021677EF9|nr:host-nuclease inhibitor Gam family protein [Arhodomonas aquaeolei]MCS4503868.1 host-nuclease inhibitor Gam family protein [Arhodomonas aquaeolei]
MAGVMNDRELWVRPDQQVCSAWVDIDRCVLGSRFRRAIGDIERKYQRLLQMGEAQSWPPVIGRWRPDGRFAIDDGGHEYLAALALGRAAAGRVAGDRTDARGDERTMTDENPMEAVEARAEEYAAARDELAGHVQSLERRIENIKREALPQIREAVRNTSEAHDRLRAAVETHPDLWTGKRRTVVIAGVRVGMQKGKGKLSWDDAGQVVKLIRKHFPDQAEAMIRVKEEPIRKALGELSVAELRKVGVTVEDTEDQVVIKPTDSEVDKLVDKLLQDAERIEAEEPAE